MKVLVVIVLAIGSVSALGSGPYLPSGWRPQGPSFYLPSEVQAIAADNPLKETLFQETEASGSDSLREYGPPKQQVVSLVTSNQGLPDVATEQTFQVTSLDAPVEEIQNYQVTAEQKSTVVEEVATTESVVNKEKAESVVTGPTYESIAEEQTESVVAGSTFESIVDEQTRSAITESVYEIVEEQTGSAAVGSTIENKGEEKTESVVTEPTYESIVEEQTTLIGIEPVFGGRAVAVDIEAEVDGTTPVSVDLAETSQTTLQELETTEKNAELQQQTEVQTSVEQKVVLESNAEIEKTEQAVVDNLSEVKNAEEIAGEEKLEEVQRVGELIIVAEEVKTVEEGVKNIAEALISLEKEINAEQVQTEVKLTQDQEVPTAGSLEQAPEGFLEYGPPGFREYGPPTRDDLLTTADVQESIDSIGTNALRKRRFSPKFRSTKRH